MTYTRFLLAAIWLTSVLFFVIGCSSTVAPISTPIPQADTPIPHTGTPIPQTDTPAPTETQIPTETPEPSPSSTQAPTDTPTPLPPSETPTPASVEPQPDSTLSGKSTVNNVADSATIDLMVSEDGTSLTQVDISIINLSIDCSATFAGVEQKGSISADSQIISYYSIPISEGVFETNDFGGEFTSPTEANGWIHLFANPSGVVGPPICDYGQWYWSATAE